MLSLAKFTNILQVSGCTRITVGDPCVIFILLEVMGKTLFLSWEKVVNLIELLYKAAANTFSPAAFLLLFDTFWKRLVIFENENIYSIPKLRS